MNTLITGNAIIVNFEGKTFTVQKGAINYGEVMDAIKEKDENALRIALTPASLVENLSSSLTIEEDSVLLDGEVLPNVLSERILAYIKEKIPVESLLLFARKLRKNPSLNSRKMLYAFLEHNGHPITDSGNFIAYKSVRRDFKDAHSGKYDNSVGNVIEMSREEVDDNPNNTCSEGLHVACYAYASIFSELLLDVEVDPADVVAVPTDYNGTKMRVCRYKVIAVSEGQRNTIYEETGANHYSDLTCKDAWGPFDRITVGKTYRDSKGREVTIVRYNEDFKYPYKGDDGYTYSSNGNFYAEPSVFDLVEVLRKEDGDEY